MQVNSQSYLSMQSTSPFIVPTTASQLTPNLDSTSTPCTTHYGRRVRFRNYFSHSMWDTGGELSSEIIFIPHHSCIKRFLSNELCPLAVVMLLIYIHLWLSGGHVNCYVYIVQLLAKKDTKFLF